MYGNDEKSFPAFLEYIQVVGTGRSLKDRKCDQRGMDEWEPIKIS
jgi:hypothetical protein